MLYDMKYTPLLFPACVYNNVNTHALYVLRRSIIIVSTWIKSVMRERKLLFLQILRCDTIGVDRGVVNHVLGT